MDKLILKSPAKLNLYLNVLRKRPDGYHDIETIFEKIALFDIITIRDNKKGIRITTDSAALPAGENNLAYKAAKALFEKAGFKGGVWIDIKKTIPVAAGLGGGSSNAATTLLGVNKFFKLGLNKRELMEIGRQLGADVPFFLYDCSFALGSGRGDQIRRINSDINIWHIVVSFKFGISTKSVYNDPSLRLTPGRVGVKMCARFICGPNMENSVENLAVWLYNKLEESTLRKAEVIGAAKRLLVKEGAYGALLSGSGPTVFGITKTREEADGVRNRVESGLSKKAGKIFVVKTLSVAR